MESRKGKGRRGHEIRVDSRRDDVELEDYWLCHCAMMEHQSIRSGVDSAVDECTWRKG